MSDYRARAASILNGATGGQESWSKWDFEVFDVVDAAEDEIESLRAEIARLRVVKTATLKIADERAKEAVELRAKLESARKALEQFRGYCDRWKGLPSISGTIELDLIRVALADEEGKS